MNKGTRTSPEYNAWRSMKRRCLLPKTKNFYLYGGRGITICAEWLNDYDAFFAVVGIRPSAKHSLDRFPDPDGNYEPGNVRWATREEQNRNRPSFNVFVAFNGEMVTVSQWAELTGKSATMLYQRLRKGWPLEKAMSLPFKSRLAG